MLIEEWLEGEEFGAQAVVEGEQCKLLILHSDVTTAPPRRIPLDMDAHIQMKQN